MNFLNFQMTMWHNLNMPHHHNWTKSMFRDQIEKSSQVFGTNMNQKESKHQIEKKLSN